MEFIFYVSFDGSMNKKVYFFHNNRQYTFEEQGYDYLLENSQKTIKIELKSLDDAIKLASSFFDRNTIKNILIKYLKLNEDKLLDALYNHNIEQKDSIFDKYVKIRKFIETNYDFYDDICDDLLYLLIEE